MKARRQNSILDQLLADGHICSLDARAEPLAGGVSSDIYLVEDGQHKWVVKRALAKLKVQADWFADTSRNHFEHKYLTYVGAFLPEAVPRVILEGDGYFAMEYLGDGFANWKTLMLDGRYELDHAVRAGKILGIIHKTSQGDVQAQERFDTTTNFHQLRSSPYLVTTGRRHPDLTGLFEAEVSRLESTRECLVHGDYSPKNILIAEDRLVVLDCEVAWFGDPAFDLAFLLTHLHLKAVHRPKAASVLSSMVQGAVAAYLAVRRLDENDVAQLRQRTHRLLMMLLLARIDGKSPVEYLTDPSLKEWVRQFTRQALLANKGAPAKFSDKWFKEVARMA